MEPQVVTEKITRHLVAHSGLDAKRNYLGMSGIARCPRQLYDEFLYPRRINEQSHLYCYSGYLFERDMKTRLADLGIYAPDSERELVAPFDARFMGHTDGETTDGELLEIKSINTEGFALVRQQTRAKPDHYLQVQCYMRYGAYAHALLVYVCRENMRHVVLRIARSDMHGDELETKAKTILQAVDARARPACVCGYCKR